MCTLDIGATIIIKRSNGKTQKAIVSAIDYEVSCVKVEWFENGETKGKEIHFTNVASLNPDLILVSVSKRPNYKSEIYKTDDMYVNKNKRRFSSAGQEARAHSAKPRLTQQEVRSEIHDDLTVQGKRIPNTTAKSTRSVIENISKFKETSMLKKLTKLEKDRLERRRKNAEVKAEKEKISKLNEHNPHWELSIMINQYRNSIEFKPLTLQDHIEEHLITVAVRKRPINSKEASKKEIDIITIPSKNQLIVHEPKCKVDLTRYLDNHLFTFDYTFNEKCTNEIVYRYTAQPLIKTIFEGGFATCFAYGQTGSGKTYTMSGNFEKGDEQGIYALAASDIFNQIRKCKYKNLAVSCSFYEIHVKKVADLLNAKKNLKVLEDGKQQVQVVGLTEKKVNCEEDVLQLIKSGTEERASGQTSANLNSSRSHAIFQIYLRPKNNLKILHGKFSLIDLAGNERGADTFLASKLTRLEGSEINQSLLSLKECIRALGRKGAHLPFRGSKLTQVLRDSFVGSNSKTCMIAMVSPGVNSCENTLNTLRYADRVKELGGGDAPANKTSENDLQEDFSAFHSAQNVAACEKQGDFDNLPEVILEETIVTMNKNVVAELRKSAQDIEELLNAKCDFDSYKYEWNGLLENILLHLKNNTM